MSENERHGDGETQLQHVRTFVKKNFVKNIIYLSATTQEESLSEICLRYISCDLVNSIRCESCNFMVLKLDINLHTNMILHSILF